MVHAHGLLLVSEYEDKRLVCFRADAECMPLQVLTPPHCGRLGGLIADGDWIIAVDASRSRFHYFFVAPRTADDEQGAADAQPPRGEGPPSSPSSPSSPATSLRQRLLADLQRMNGDAAAPAGNSSGGT